MPGANSESAGMKALAESCSCPIVVMTFSIDDDAKKYAQLLGAARMVDKAGLYGKLLPTVVEVIADRTI
jgi:hypothetical protein